MAMNQGRKIALGIALIILIGVLLLGVTPSFFSKWQARKDCRECIMNMRQISGAIKSWSLEFKRYPGEVVQAKDVALYMKHAAMPVCPSGGAYQMRVGSEFYGDVSCSVHGPVQ